MFLRAKRSLGRPASKGFIALCFTLLLGGLVVGTIYLLSTIRPLPPHPLPTQPPVGMEEVA